MQQLPERLMSVTIPAENVPRVSHEEQQLPPDTPSSPSRGVVRSLEADGKTRRRSKDNLLLACEMEEMDDKTTSAPGAAALDQSLREGERIAKQALDDGGIVGSFSCHGRDSSPYGMQDKINQDCACVAHSVGGHVGTALLCVYDGHGQSGHDVSLEALFSVHEELERRPELLLREPAQAFEESFDAVQEHLKVLAAVADNNSSEEVVVDATESGACALVALLRGSKLWVANAGDCRAVLGRKGRDGVLTALPLSTDHKCNLPNEQARIEAAGAWVRPASGAFDSEDHIPARVYEDRGNPRKGPGLCIARSIGDLNANRSGVIPTPEVTLHEVGPDDRFLILASDGVWEFFSDEQVVSLVDRFYERKGKAIDACRLLIAQSALQWRTHEGAYRDDITAVVVWLPPLVEALQRAEHEGETIAMGATGMGA